MHGVVVPVYTLSRCTSAPAGVEVIDIEPYVGITISSIVAAAVDIATVPVHNPYPSILRLIVCTPAGTSVSTHGVTLSVYVPSKYTFAPDGVDVIDIEP
jgi:hypothetical protein